MTYRQLIGLSAFFSMILLVFSQVVLSGGQAGSWALAVESALLTLFLSLLFCVKNSPNGQPAHLSAILMTGIGLGIYQSIKSLALDNTIPWFALCGIVAGATFALALVTLLSHRGNQGKT